MEITIEALYLTVIIVLIVAFVGTILRPKTKTSVKMDEESGPEWANTLFAVGAKLCGLVCLGAAIAYLCFMFRLEFVRELDPVSISFVVLPGLSLVVFGLLLSLFGERLPLRITTPRLTNFSSDVTLHGLARIGVVLVGLGFFIFDLNWILIGIPAISLEINRGGTYFVLLIIAQLAILALPVLIMLGSKTIVRWVGIGSPPDETTATPNTQIPPA